MNTKSSNDDELQRLMLRISALENGAARAPEPPKPEPVRVQPPPIPVVVVPPPIFAPKPRPVPPPAPTPIVTPKPIHVAVAAPPRKRLANDELEALVGGSIINKIGAFILVIGIALFLGYSFGHLGPAGRSAICVAVSLSMLLTGIFAEKRPQFRIFSRGLIGAGWATLYATAYAVYAIPAARLIDDPFIGSLGVLAVACGMIAHSLKYREQAVTAIAYFAAFAAIAFTPAAPFAAISLVPLAASLLYLATRFNWYPMAVFGTLATYGTCMLKGGDPNGSLAAAQLILLVYWLLFEAFDLMRTRHTNTGAAADWIFPVNACGFLGISYLAWFHHAPDQLWLAASIGAALYLASAIIRAIMRPPSSFKNNEDLMARMQKGSFEGATLLAVTLAAMAILGGSPTNWSSFAFAIEAEILFLAGLAFRSDFLRRIGALFFAVSLGRLAWTSTPDVHLATPGALLHAFLFTINRFLRRSIFSTLAVALIAFVLAVNLGYLNAALAWTIFGLALLELGLFTKEDEFRMQGAVLATCGILGVVTLSIAIAPQPWQPLAACVALIYAFTLQVRFRDAAEEDSEIFQSAGAWTTALTSAVLLWQLLPIAQLGIGLAILAVTLFELGLRKLPSALTATLIPLAVATLATPASAPTLLIEALCGAIIVVRTRQSHLNELIGNSIATLAAAAFLAFLGLTLPVSFLSLAILACAGALLETGVRTNYPFLKWLTLAYSLVTFAHLCTIDIPGNAVVIPIASIAGLYWLHARFQKLEDSLMQNVMLWSALIPLAYLPFAQFHEQAAPWWAAIALALLAYGTFKQDQMVRLQSYCMFVPAAAFVIAYSSITPDLAISIPTIAIFYAAHFLARKHAEILSIAATTLLTAVLFGEVSGGMLTVAWGTAGVTLLSIGFPFRNRALRLEGLALLLICTLKLFLYDLRNLDTPYRILSFIVLGLMLMCVSWIYTRFRDQVRRIL